MNLEMRWFFEGQLPEGVLAWCQGKGFTPEGTRSDIYLLFKSSDLGVKYREGKCEIKYRTCSEPFLSRNFRISGRMERWGKSSLDLKDPLTNPFHNVEGPQVTVEKERYSCKYEIDPQKGTVTPAKDKKKINQGVMVEVTKLTVKGEQYWTMDIDALGEQQEVSLKIGVEEVLKDYPGPNPREENSFSYPEWLNREIKRV
jgi:hypothetical protein